MAKYSTYTPYLMFFLIKKKKNDPIIFLPSLIPLFLMLVQVTTIVWGE